MVRWMLVAVAIVAALALAACGGASDDQGAGDDAPSAQTERTLSPDEVAELVANGSASEWTALAASAKSAVVERFLTISGGDADNAELVELMVASVDGGVEEASDGASLHEVLDSSYEVAKALGSTDDFDTAACEAQLGELLGALEEIDGRLDVGLTLRDYADRVGDAQVAYRRIDVKALEPGCVSEVGVFAEQALNRYREVEDRWSACVSDVYCDMDSIDPMMQRNWERASQLIDRARSGLSG